MTKQQIEILAQLADKMEDGANATPEEIKAVRWAANELMVKTERQKAKERAKQLMAEIIQAHEEDELLIYHTQDKLKELLKVIEEKGEEVK